MTAAVLLNVVGLLLVTIGGFVLAFSLGRALLDMRNAIACIDSSVKDLASPHDVIIAVGLPKRLAASARSAALQTLLGCILLGLGSALQLVALVIPICHKVT